MKDRSLLLQTRSGYSYSFRRGGGHWNQCKSKILREIEWSVCVNDIDRDRGGGRLVPCGLHLAVIPVYPNVPASVLSSAQSGGERPLWFFPKLDYTYRPLVDIPYMVKLRL